MHKEISIMKQNVYSNIINGVAWCLYGFVNMFENVPCQILSGVFIVIALFTTSMVLFGKREDDDEMSIRHKEQAESATFRLIMMAVCLVGVLGIFRHDLSLNFYLAYPFVIGAAEFHTGILFAYYEKVGTKCQC